MPEINLRNLFIFVVLYLLFYFFDAFIWRSFCSNYILLDAEKIILLEYKKIMTLYFSIIFIFFFFYT